MTPQETLAPRCSRLSTERSKASTLAIQMRRREFITLVGALVAWSLAAHAQQPERVRMIGALMPFTADDTEGTEIVAALRQGLQELGWKEGRNIRVDYRWGGRNVERTRAYATELVGLSPDLIFAFFNAQLAPLSRETRTIPIVFVGASDPVGAGYVASLARPGGNITGFTLYEPSFVGKWLEVLKETTPAVARVAIMVNPDTAILRGTFYLRAFDTAAATFKVEPITARVHSIGDIEAAIMLLGQQPHSGLIVAPDTFTLTHAERIITLAAQHRLPAVYGFRQSAALGGLISYGPDILNTVQRSASYMDRILKGEKPGDLPVQAPTKFELVVNLKTAKATGVEVPATLLARADEVIE
jgi:putative tryptophan/tyrosine transport system substrate-binding protein